MKVFVAGAGGAIGLPLVRRLAAAGHEVSGLTRGGSGADRIRQAGGEAVVCDVFARADFVRAVADISPEVVINQLTSLPQKFEPKKTGYYEANDRIRSEGGDNVIEATAAAGARRLITQSISFLYELSGPMVKSEDEPLDSSGRLDATIEHERKALGDGRFEAAVLRYGLLYGPGTWYAKDGHLGREVRRRRLPIVGDGGGYSSFLHVEDAASAALTVLDGGSGIFNVTDDEPAPTREWIPVFAEAMGAKPPRKVPFWLASLVGGKQLATFAVQGRGASNAKFKAATGWTPAFSSWRTGFRS